MAEHDYDGSMARTFADLTAGMLARMDVHLTQCQHELAVALRPHLTLEQQALQDGLIACGTPPYQALCDAADLAPAMPKAAARRG